MTKRIALISFAIVVSLASLEVGLRLFGFEPSFPENFELTLITDWFIPSPILICQLGSLPFLKLKSRDGLKSCSLAALTHTVWGWMMTRRIHF